MVQKVRKRVLRTLFPATGLYRSQVVRNHSTDNVVSYKSLDFMGYPMYRVGDDGSVWSFWKGYWRQAKPANGGGRMLVNLCKESKGKAKTFTVSRLILFAFVGPCPDKMECCHCNGDFTDNKLSNLRWDFHSENEKDKKNHGTSHFHGESHYRAKLTEDDVREIRKLYSTKKYSLSYLANLYDVAVGTIYPIVKKKTWKHVI